MTWRQITTYTLRHTLADVLNNELFMNIGDVGLILNHSNA